MWLVRLTMGPQTYFLLISSLAQRLITPNCQHFSEWANTLKTKSCVSIPRNTHHPTNPPQPAQPFIFSNVWLHWPQNIIPRVCVSVKYKTKIIQKSNPYKLLEVDDELVTQTESWCYSHTFPCSICCVFRNSSEGVRLPWMPSSSVQWKVEVMWKQANLQVWNFSKNNSITVRVVYSKINEVDL